MSYKIEIYMKSGNIIKIKVKDMKLKYLGEKVTSMDWESYKDDNRLMHIDLTQIEAVVRR